MQVDFPGGAITDTVLAQVTMQAVVGRPTGAHWPMLPSFVIKAWDSDGQPVTQFNRPFTLTLTYAESDWQDAGIPDESQLNLSVWQDDQWQGLLPCVGCVHDQTANRLVAVLDHLSHFVTLADFNKTYLSQVINPLNCFPTGDSDSIDTAFKYMQRHSRQRIGQLRQSDRCLQVELMPDTRRHTDPGKF